ncbi:MAG: DUF5677 domain-containing protein [Acidobacteriaceae bacterium]|nr:DUF5677 domain-containing protein [Acidobacteriaceae bacterium]
MDSPNGQAAHIELLLSLVAGQIEATSELCVILEDLLKDSENGTPSSRRVILVAGTRRSIQAARIIQGLAKDWFIEDMAVLGRTLAEAAINACYLQVCSEQEFRRFMIFDAIADLRLHEELKSATGYVPSPETEVISTKSAQQALSSGLFSKKPRTWTDIPLAERGSP